jgi:hypothetical protein
MADFFCLAGCSTVRQAIRPAAHTPLILMMMMMTLLWRGAVAGQEIGNPPASLSIVGRLEE